MSSEEEKANLIMGVLSCSEEILLQARQLLVAAFGKIDRESPHIPFDFTRYYEKEMGKGLIRCWLSFQNLIAADNLAEIKAQTQEIESHFSLKNRRRINLDPGYITAAKLVLASRKNYSHRLYLGKGIFAEVSLIYKKDAFHALGWTYPDYRSSLARQFFKEIREIYKKKITFPENLIF